MQNHPQQLGPYQIIRPLGRGGMGAVYEGLHLKTGEPAAVKVLLETLGDDPEIRSRFEAEIDALKMLRHPHIVRLNGFGEEDGRLYYVMELVQGQNLYQELKRKRSFTWQDVAKIGFEVCLALKHGHDRGIVHRDIKPANIMLDDNGSLKLSDYGIAHFFGNSRLTSSNSVIGTIEFMSPEQAQAASITPKSDLYSLGAVLYTLLCRRPPLLAKTLPEIIKKHNSEQPEGILSLRRDVPGVLVNVVHDLLEIKPENRPPNAYLVAKQIESLLVSEFGATDAVIVLPSGNGASGTHDKGGDEKETRTEFNVLERHQRPGDSVFLLQLEDQLSPTRQMTQDEIVAENETSGTKTSNSCFIQVDSSKKSLLSLATDAKEREKPTFPNSDYSDSTVSSQENYVEKNSSSRFVPVRDEELGRYRDDVRGKDPLISVQVGVLSICLVVFGLWAWYMLQPKSADSLYQLITSRTKLHPESLEISPAMLTVENDVNKFLELYPKDSRISIVQMYRNEITLAKEERQLEWRLSSVNSDKPLLPVQKAYLEAIILFNIQPEKAVAKLQAIIDLFGGPVTEEPDFSNPNGICVELAKRRLKLFRRELELVIDLETEQISGFLERIEDIETTDANRANRMRRGLIELYQEKSWAQELLERVKKNVQ